MRFERTLRASDTLTEIIPWMETLFVFGMKARTPDGTIAFPVRTSLFALMCSNTVVDTSGNTHRFITLPGRQLRAVGPAQTHEYGNKEKTLYLMRAAQNIVRDFSGFDANGLENLSTPLCIAGRDTEGLLQNEPLSPVHPRTAHETIFATAYIGCSFKEMPPCRFSGNLEKIYPDSPVKKHKIVAQWVDIRGLLGRLEHANGRKFNVLPPPERQGVAAPLPQIDGLTIRMLEKFMYNHMAKNMSHEERLAANISMVKDKTVRACIDDYRELRRRFHNRMDLAQLAL